MPSLVRETLPTELTLSYRDFLGEEPLRVKERLHLELTEHTYLPKTKDPRADWVASVAMPAFRALRAEQPDGIGAFATVGTGVGMDALAAIEMLRPNTVMVTDIHPDVVVAAQRNVATNLVDGHGVELLSGTGALGEPLQASGCTYDVVYENLPNIPLPEDQTLANGMASSSFVDRDLPVGPLASRYLLGLHAQLLGQAHSFLNPQGQVLSSIGARVPLQAILGMADEAGCDARLLTYTWKIQTEAEDVVGGYARCEAEGKGPFYFYPVEAVRRVFSRYASASEAALHAFEIEKELEPSRLCAQEALKLVGKRIPLAHTVAVIASQPHATD